MFGMKVGVNELANKEGNIGTASLLLSGGIYAADSISVLEDVYKEALAGKVSDSKIEIYRTKLGKLFSKIILMDKCVDGITDNPDFHPEDLEVDSPEFDAMVQRYKSQNMGTTIGAYVAHLYDAVGKGDSVSIVEASKVFRRSSLETFDVDLPRMRNVAVKLDDGRESKLFEFIGYDTIDEMKEDTKENRNNNFVKAFRDQGLGDRSIANIAMNLNQKALISGSAYAGIFCVAANQGHISEISHEEAITIDRTGGSVTVQSRAKIAFRSMEHLEKKVPAFRTLTEYTISPDPDSISNRSFEELMGSTMGYDVKPMDPSVQILSLGEFKLPNIDTVVSVQDLNNEDLDKLLPPFEKDSFTIDEVRQTFGQVFGMQRGSAFSLGVDGRLVDIICNERELAGKTKFKSLQGFDIKESHIKKLVERLAEEQKDKMKDANIEKIADETIELIKLRSRLNKFSPEKKLPAKKEGVKFGRFSFAYEFWNKIKHIFRVFDAAKNIEEAVRLDNAKADTSARSTGAMHSGRTGGGMSH